MVSPGAKTYADDINDIADATTSKPLVRMIQTVTQSIPDATLTGVTFTTEEIDTHGFHDTGSNTSRITPTVAGYYRVFGVYYTGTMTTPVAIDASFRKNGATSFASGTRITSIGTSAQGMAASCIMSMNGSTDYVELVAFQDSNGAVNTNVSSRFSSYFECEFLRPL